MQEDEASVTYDEYNRCLLQSTMFECLSWTPGRVECSEPSSQRRQHPFPNTSLLPSFSPLSLSDPIPSPSLVLSFCLTLVCAVSSWTGRRDNCRLLILCVLPTRICDQHRTGKARALVQWRQGLFVLPSDGLKRYCPCGGPWTPAEGACTQVHTETVWT